MLKTFKCEVCGLTFDSHGGPSKYCKAHSSRIKDLRERINTVTKKHDLWREKELFGEFLWKTAFKANDPVGFTEQLKTIFELQFETHPDQVEDQTRFTEYYNNRLESY